MIAKPLPTEISRELWPLVKATPRIPKDSKIDVFRSPFNSEIALLIGRDRELGALFMTLSELLNPEQWQAVIKKVIEHAR